jgi:hypothetical protein
MSINSDIDIYLVLIRIVPGTGARLTLAQTQEKNI